MLVDVSSPASLGQRPGPNPFAPDRDWWRGAAIYQIYPRSFQDSNGDGIGDLAGIRQRLPYVAGLGVDAIWISPFFLSPMKDFGYDVSDYRAVDPMFGTMDDFDAVVEEAHRLGLKVMIDLVISHTSDEHPWFRESRAGKDGPKADWYVWADPRPDGSPPNNWLSMFGGSAWQWDPKRMQYYLHNFLPEQPDLNFHNPDVQDAVLDVARFWLDRGVDGFRLDTVNYYFHSQGLEDNPALPESRRNASTAPAVNPYNFQDHLYDKSRPENLAFLERFRSLTDEYPAAAIVGEVGEAQRGLEVVSAYTSGNSRVHMCYAFDFLGPEKVTADRVRGVIEAFEAVAGDGWMCWAMSNHDTVRHATRLTGGEADRLAYLKVLSSMLFCFRGSVCIYQGEELGLEEAELSLGELRDPYGIRFWPEFKGRDGCRTPMPWDGGCTRGGFSSAAPWLPVSRTHLGMAAGRQEGRPGALLEHYRRFLRFRKSRPALVKGTIEFLDAGDGGNVVAFRRRHPSESLVCAFNLGSEPASVRLPAGTRVSDTEGHGLEEGMLADGRIDLAQYGAFIGVEG